MEVKNLPDGVYFLLEGNLYEKNGAIWQKIKGQKATCVSPPCSADSNENSNLHLWRSRNYDVSSYSWIADEVL